MIEERFTLKKDDGRIAKGMEIIIDAVLNFFMWFCVILVVACLVRFFPLAWYLGGRKNVDVRKPTDGPS